MPRAVRIAALAGCLSAVGVLGLVAIASGGQADAQTRPTRTTTTTAPTTTVPPSTVPPSTVPATVPVGTSVAPGSTVPNTTPGVTSPDGCIPFDPPTVRFVGIVRRVEAPVVTFDVAEVRDGALATATVDVEYEQDSRFFRVGERYLVAALADPESGKLSSKVRRPRGEELPLSCTVSDQVVSLNEDGSVIDTGLLAGMKGKWGRVAFLIVLPALVAFAVLAGLVLLKYLVLGIVRLPSWLRGERRPRDVPPPDRVRSP